VVNSCVVKFFMILSVLFPFNSSG